MPIKIFKPRHLTLVPVCLCPYFCSSGSVLRLVSLSNMHISDRDGASLCAVVEHNSTLRGLDLSRNDLGEKSSLALGISLAVGGGRGRGPAHLDRTSESPLLGL